MAGYTGVWRSKAYQAPSLQGNVPEATHLQPQDDEDQTPNWSETGDLPIETTFVEDRQIFAVDSAPGGPTYDPPPHSEGIGFGAGLSAAASKAQNDAAHMTDDGSIQARLPNPMGERDGAFHSDRFQNIQDINGLRPAGTPDIPAAPGMSQGLNPEEYPNRYLGHRRWDWRDRVFERRTWSVDFRPIITPNAYSAPDIAGGDAAYVSPYPAAQSTYVRNVPPVAPQLRRTPDAWDQSITQDGTEMVPYQDPQFESWGL